MRYSVLLVTSAFLILTACNRKDQKIDIPDINHIYGNIQYLDSLLQSVEVDSIASMTTRAESLVATRSDNFQSPDDQAILDSVNRIISVSSKFLRFCIDSRTNIELLRQDVASAEVQHTSGKINTGQFIRSLIESEQILVDINNRFEDERLRVTNSLQNLSSLRAILNPLPVQEQ